MALAIDGGMVFSDRRQAQNGSDAASLAGGGAAALYLENNRNDIPALTYPGWNCSHANMTIARNLAVTTAIDRAASNEFIIDGDPADMNGAIAVCGQVDNGSWIDKYIDVTANISTTTNTSFAYLIFPTPLQNKVLAVTRVRPPIPFAFGNAIVALRTDCPNNSTGGVHFDGNAQVIINGGGIFSNACLVANGGVDVVVNGGDNTCLGEGCYTENGGANVTPTPTQGGPELPPYSYTVPEPNCDAMPDRGSHTGDGTIQPGRYTQIRLNNGDLTMQPGVYCITEDDFTVNGGHLIGSDVTIFIEEGSFQSNGNANVNIDAPPAESCGEPCTTFGAIEGVLIYLAEGNTHDVALLGGADSDYFGLVFAPNGTIEAGGSGSLMAEIHAQLIGYTVFVHGNTQININYNNEEQKWKPAMVELYR